MRQSELYRAVAQVTGENLSTIKRLGFLLAPEPEMPETDDGDFGPLVIDWDEIQAQRHTAMIGGAADEPAAA